MSSETKPIVPRGVEAEPSAGSAPMPVFFFVLLAVFVFWGMIALDRTGGGFNNRVYRPYESYARLAAAQPKTVHGENIAKGQNVYTVTCSLCHQPNGLGTPGQFPPLDGSEWVTGNEVGRLIRIPIHGLTGPIKIKGEEWNAAMPAMGAALSDEDLSALLTFVRQAWSNKAGPIKVDQVKAVREATATRTEPWTSEDLLAIPD